MKNTLGKIARGVLCAVMFLVIIASVVLAELSGATKFLLSDGNFYADCIVTDEYVDSIYELSLEKIKNACGMYGFDYGAVSGCFDKARIRELSREYIVSLYESIRSGEGDGSVSFGADAFTAAIDEYADAHADEINEAYALKENRVALGTALAETVTNSVNSFSGQTITKNAHKLLFENRFVKLLPKLFFPALALIVIAAALVITVGLKGGKGAYLSALAAYIGALLCFLPIREIRNFDVSHVILRGSTYALFTSTWNGVFGALYRYTLIWLIAAIVLALISVVLYAFSPVKGAAPAPEESDAPIADAPAENKSVKDEQANDEQASEKQTNEPETDAASPEENPRDSAPEEK